MNNLVNAIINGKSISISFKFWGGEFEMFTDTCNVAITKDDSENLVVEIGSDVKDRTEFTLEIIMNKRETEIEFSEDEYATYFVVKHVGVTGLVKNMEINIVVER